MTIIGGEWQSFGNIGNENFYLESKYLVINDGKFGMIQYPKEAVITINGGSFEGTFLAFQADGVTININGGEFSISNFIYADSGEWSINITGGTFNIDPTRYIVEGYTATLNDNGTWTVVKNS